MLSEGTVIQGYKITGLIGKGGMGEVYRGEDVELGREVAIKALNPLLTQDSSFVERFRNEAKLQARLIHPNIVSLFTLLKQENAYYMVMEYAEGRTLRDLMRQVGPIPEQRALKILQQLLSALQFAHSRNIVHRDIKPTNIILDDKDNVKILDFGIAKIIGEKGLTRTGQNVGTVVYMSPEQVSNPRDVDHRTDIYSLGVTLFEMLSGRQPYMIDTDSDFALMNAVVNQEIPDPRQFYPHISDSTVDILSGMLEKDKEFRFGSCAEIGDAIMGVGSQDEEDEEFDPNQFNRARFPWEMGSTVIDRNRNSSDEENEDDEDDEDESETSEQAPAIRRIAIAKWLVGLSSIVGIIASLIEWDVGIGGVFSALFFFSCLALMLTQSKYKEFAISTRIFINVTMAIILASSLRWLGYAYIPAYGVQLTILASGSILFYMMVIVNFFRRRKPKAEKGKE